MLPPEQLALQGVHRSPRLLGAAVLLHLRAVGGTCSRWTVSGFFPADKREDKLLYIQHCCCSTAAKIPLCVP